MAYAYRNVKTGEVIKTTNKVSGKNWEPVQAPQKPHTGEASGEETASTTPKKNTARGKK